MKILFIGLGSIGLRHLRNLNSIDEFEFYAFRQRNIDLPPEFDNYNLVQSSNWQEISKNNYDLCVICSPPQVQEEILPQVIAMGINFFIEKPIGVNLFKLKGWREFTSNLITMVGFNLRFHPVVIRLKELLNEKIVGNISSFRLEVGQYLPDWHPNEDYRHNYSANKNLGGGVSLDLIHELDLAFFLFGPAVKILSLSGKNSHLETNVEETAEYIYKTVSGAVGNIHLDYINRFGSRKGIILGDLGVIEYDLVKNNVKVSLICKEAHFEDFHFERNDMYLNEMKSFISSIKSQTKIENDFTHGTMILEYALSEKNI